MSPSKRAKWDLAVGLSGVVWVVLTLALTLSSPAILILLALVAGYEMLAGHRAA